MAPSHSKETNTFSTMTKVQTHVLQIQKWNVTHERAAPQSTWAVMWQEWKPLAQTGLQSFVGLAARAGPVHWQHWYLRYCRCDRCSKPAPSFLKEQSCTLKHCWSLRTHFVADNSNLHKIYTTRKKHCRKISQICTCCWTTMSGSLTSGEFAVRTATGFEDPSNRLTWSHIESQKQQLCWEWALSKVLKSLITDRE
jgi:hypothetical protein